MPPPPPLVRRLVLAPAFVVVTLLVLVTVPMVAIVAVVISPLIPGRWRPLRLLAFLIVYLAIESAGLVALAAMWVAAGFGSRLDEPAWQARHYELLRRMLGGLVDAARWLFDVTFDVTGADPMFDGDVDTTEAMPLLVLSRHAGPGDSFLLVNALLQDGHRPRIVLRDLLQWEPLLDIILNRLPTQFVGPSTAGQASSGIAFLADSMGPGDVLVIFPEGGNFTPTRRLRSIARLEELGQHERADRARAMRHVLSPRTGGTKAALAAAPTADVLFVAHTGLEQLSGIVDLWRGLPMDAAVQVITWRVAAADHPDTDSEIADWLDEWFHRIDGWIYHHVDPEYLPDAISKTVPDVTD